MFTNLIQNTKHELTDSVKSAYFSAVIDFFLVVALLLFSVAIFVWADERYGAVTAGLGLGVAYLALAVCVSLFAASWRRARARENEARLQAQQALMSEQPNLLDPNWLTSPAALATGLEVARKIAARTDAPKLLIPAAVVGLALIIAVRRMSRPAT